MSPPVRRLRDVAERCAGDEVVARRVKRDAMLASPPSAALAS